MRNNCRPSTNAIMGLIFADYVLQPFYPPDCGPPEISRQLIAAATICNNNYYC